MLKKIEAVKTYLEQGGGLPLKPIEIAKVRGEQADTGGSGSKRKLQDSPTRVETPTKRSRKTGTVLTKRVPEEKVDLTGHQFLEDSEISAVTVPRAARKVGIW
jgi:hypothetical protein